MPEDVKSRQQRWAEKKRADGLCRLCGEPRVNATFCEEHAKKAREYSRKRAGYRPWHPGGKGRRPNWGKEAIAEIEACCGIEQKKKFRDLLDRTEE